MSKTEWQPTNQPGRYDKARVASLEPIRQAIKQLQLPLIRMRKLMAVTNALEMQVEDGGDAPEVNSQLLEALKLVVVHQVGHKRATAVIQAIEDFARKEEVHWAQVRAGTLPFPKLDPDEKLDELIQTGYELMSRGQTNAGCDQWLLAWEQVKKMAAPDMRTVEAFDEAYPGPLQSVLNWSQDLEMELHNAGLSNPIYFEHRIRYVREYLAQFPNDDADNHVAFRQAEGEALWLLGRKSESETVYRTLVTTFPDKAWGYIGWSDQYYMWRDVPADYKRAEEILNQALARPNLDDRRSVQDRLADLYKERKETRQTKPVALQNPAKNRKRSFRGGRKKKR